MNLTFDMVVELSCLPGKEWIAFIATFGTVGAAFKVENCFKKKYFPQQALLEKLLVARTLNRYDPNSEF